jgi:hypothetical protein
VDGVTVSYQFKDANTVPWRKSTFAEGIEVKDLGTSDARSMQLVRFAAGASSPRMNIPVQNSSTCWKAPQYRKEKVYLPLGRRCCRRNRPD